MLYLTTAFHCNLGFSSIPADQYSLVLDRCYWPMLELADQGIAPLGVELPASTLREIERIDRSWAKRLAELWHAGKVEVIGSGEVQAIFPLIQAGVNARNLALGQREYERLLGRRPTTAYLNEQVYAAGLLALYREAGYDLLIVEWNNVAKYAGLARETQYCPLTAEGPDGTTMTVWWNNSVAFQKLQRFAAGQLTPEAYQDYVLGHRGESPRALMIYGSDAEVFDYRPGEFRVSFEAVPQGGEWTRIRDGWRRLLATDGVAFATPRDAVRLLPVAGRARLESPECPLPTKKQEKYNVTRWAVGGRDNVMINTLSERLARNVERVHGLACALGEGTAALERLTDAIVELWASDARTHTTETKHERFLERLGWLTHEVASTQRRFLGRLAARAPLTVVNPLAVPWQGEPAEVALQFPTGALRQVTGVVVDGRRYPAQIEDVSRYRDGSVRAARLVFEPELPPYALSSVELVDDGSSTQAGETSEGWGRVTTGAVDVCFRPDRGGAIATLAFPAISDQPLCGTLEHGSYDDIGYAADFYTGHAILLTPDSRQKITDLQPAEASGPANREAYPVRIPVAWRVRTEAGEWWKVYHVYRGRPRVDLTLHLRLPETRVLSFRVGIVTLLPQAFDAATLAYRTVNGGRAVEAFALHDRRVRHDEPVSHGVTSSHCVGGTEGWIDLGDERHGLCIARRLDALYSVPMIHHEPVDDTFFCRVLHSVGESDDTSRGFWRGHRTARFAILGRGEALDGVRREARGWATGLVAAGPLAAPDADLAT